jgi:hypothetical protein
MGACFSSCENSVHALPCRGGPDAACLRHQHQTHRVRPAARLVITDAACAKVIYPINEKADKKRVEEMEAEIAAALGGKE